MNGKREEHSESVCNFWSTRQVCLYAILCKATIFINEVSFKCVHGILSLSIIYWTGMPAVMCLSERHLLLLPGFIFRLCLWLECTFCIEIFNYLQREWFQEFEMHEEFLLFSCSCPLLTLAQHCKGKQIPNLNSRPKPERKTVVLSCEVHQEENKRTVASEDIFPLHLENKLFSYQTHLFNTESRWPGGGKMQCWQTHVKIWMGFWLVCSLVLHVFVPDMSPVRAEKPAMFANTCW